VTTYETVRTIAGQPLLNEALLKRAYTVRDRAYTTEFEAKAIKMSTMSSGLAKKRGFQALLRAIECPTDCVLKQVFEMVCEQAGTTPAASQGSAPKTSAAKSSAGV
jgi:hypothetical protein